MSSILRLSVDPVTLTANISLNGENERAINDLKIICSNLSDSYPYHNRIITIPWFELRRGLTGIARIRKEKA
ncbi:MAG: hypothetical protein K8R68_07395 [Bacteroidales bacterium]|nr:hypothetical protein [Bacteroidales bacterium]